MFGILMCLRSGALNEGSDIMAFDEEILGILAEIEKTLEALHCEFTKSCGYDEKFGYNGVITVIDPHIDRPLIVDVTKSEQWSEIMMEFEDWHCHCELSDISGVLDTIWELISNEFGSVMVYLGEEHRCVFGSGISRNAAENSPNAESFGLPKSYNDYWVENSAIMEIKFWDQKYDKTIELR